jgi:hypothetical protein
MKEELTPMNRSPYSAGGTAEIICYLIASASALHGANRTRQRRNVRRRRTRSYFIPLKKFSSLLTQVYGVKMSMMPYHDHNPSIQPQQNPCIDASKEKDEKQEITHEIINHSHIFIHLITSSNTPFIVIE